MTFKIRLMTQILMVKTEMETILIRTKEKKINKKGNELSRQASRNIGTHYLLSSTYYIR